jgi:hypothetical protein
MTQDETPAPTTIEHDDDAVVIRIPMTFRKRGGRTEIIAPEGLSGEASRAEPQEPMVTALARAYRWQSLLDQGRYATISELAGALGVDRSYVRRILRLALLAPDIVEGILAGRERSGLSLRILHRRVPHAWSEQRQQLGSTPPKA